MSLMVKGGVKSGEMAASAPQLRRVVAFIDSLIETAKQIGSWAQYGEPFHTSAT